MASRIEWTGETWNPIRARDKKTGRVGWFCEHASDGCRFCYAETMNRWRGNRIDYARQNRDSVELFVDQEALVKPLHWRSPRTIFPCSMTDLFGDFIPDEMLADVFTVMADTPRHTYQVLSKRSDICCKIMNGPKSHRYWHPRLWHRSVLPNVHLGVSVEQKRHLSRLHDLRETPAALRWISFEPLLEELGPLYLDGISWVVIGGESGRKARPFYLRWAYDIIEQCQRAGIAVFMKQVGACPIGLDNLPMKLIDDKGGDPAEWPEDLRVRQFPDPAR